MHGDEEEDESDESEEEGEEKQGENSENGGRGSQSLHLPVERRVDVSSVVSDLQLEGEIYLQNTYFIIKESSEVNV